jgi:ribosomal protein S18 acetylase RimI-like enzyme
MQLNVKTIYLELTRTDRFYPADNYRERVSVREIENDAYMNFMLFAGVGLPWRWYSRLDWTIEEWENYFSGSRIKTFLAFENNSVIGYYELEYCENMEVEIKFLGLLPRFIGRGLGGILLSHAVSSAMDKNIERVWLHTCSIDSGSALDNYLARGFKIFRETEQIEEVPDEDEVLKSISGFFSRYISKFRTT